MNTSMASDAQLMAWSFAEARWRLDFRNRERLESWQRKRLSQFLHYVLPNAPRYRDMKYSGLSDLPIMDKSVMMDDFRANNTRGVELEEALAVALHAEESRDFTPSLGDITVGLSSGTSGNRGVFLVSRAERLRWAGIMLARALPRDLFLRLISPWQPPLRIAFFLRANSNIYTTLDSRRIEFCFHDLLLGVDPAVPRLNKELPDLLVGPPSLLFALAAEARAGRLRISPGHVISVAEVLEDRDAAMLQESFGSRPHQLYQATEGFLGYTCESGTVHLNESYLHIEPEWMDAEHCRFQPVITDFSRDTQLIVRYRLNDVLLQRRETCPCGRADRAISKIEGRADEVIWLPSLETDRSVAIFPDQLRRAMLFAGAMVREYDVTQSGMQLKVGLLPDGDMQLARQLVESEMEKLFEIVAVRRPALSFTEWTPPEAGAKRRRVKVDQLPAGLSCTF
jgi:putative adenylate-forming enzyme